MSIHHSRDRFVININFQLAEQIMQNAEIKFPVHQDGVASLRMEIAKVLLRDSGTLWDVSHTSVCTEYSGLMLIYFIQMTYQSCVAPVGKRVQGLTLMSG